MRRRFFVDQVRNGKAELSGDDAKHLTRVLRVEAGQRYEISDNRNVYLAEIETARKGSVIFRTLEKLETPETGPRLILCAALFKFDRFEWMIEKATELGVSEIVPVETTRSERGLERAARKRVERWRRIALEASQQARRATLPVVHDPIKWRDALAVPAVRRYALDETPGVSPWGLSPVADPLDASGSIAILLGPEGGWTDEERESFAAAGWVAVSLGPLILRAETAAIAALAIANFFAAEAGVET
jgi:16S rRNA (uracil1498-N3)-methyltransferase